MNNGFISFHISRRSNFLFGSIAAILFLFLGCVDGYSQVDPDEFAPPPLKTIPKPDRERLEREKDDRSRTRLSLDLMATRLKAAETLAGAGDLNAMFTEFGIFHGLMDDAIGHLKTRDSRNSKTLDNFKRLEIGIRSFVQRIEAVRRELPLTHERYVAMLLRYVRDARAKSSDALFSDSVVPVRRPDR